jgi:hypothetical protein
MFQKRIEAMRIVLFAREGAGKHYCNAISRILPGTEVISSLDNLISRIRNRSPESLVVVLITGSQSDFADMQQMKWMLHDICTILILPDRNLETVAAGHNLHPRYMGCLDDHPAEIATFLGRMLTRENAGEAKSSTE